MVENYKRISPTKRFERNDPVYDCLTENEQQTVDDILRGFSPYKKLMIKYQRRNKI